MGIPGIKIVSPYTVLDAKGMLKAAIRSDDFIIFIEHKLLYSREGRLPKKDYPCDLERAAVLREGSDLTLISYSYMLDLCLEVAQELSAELDIEVIDLRVIKPLDLETISASVKKTKRAVFVEEGPVTGGIGAEVCAQIAENCLEFLDGKIIRVGAQDSPIPSSRDLEAQILPDKDKIREAIKRSLSW